MVQTVSGSLTAAGVTSPLTLGNDDEKVTFAIAAGTYSGHVMYFEKSKGSTLGPWDTVGGPYTTDDVAVSLEVQGRKGELFRIRVEDVATGTDEVTGTIAYTITDEDTIIQEFFDRDGNVILRLKKSGIEIPGDLSVTGDTDVTGVLTPAGSGAVNTSLAATTAVEDGNAVLRKTVLTLTAEAVVVTDALAYLGTKLYDFPAGAIKIVGITADLSFSVSSVRASTINLNAAMDWSLGSAAASNTALTSTMVNLIAKQDLTLDQADAGAHPDTAQNLTDVGLDGTTAAAGVYLNIAFPTGTDIDANGTIEVTGSITILWANAGDY